MHAGINPRRTFDPDCLTHLNKSSVTQDLEVKERIRVNQIWS